LQHDYIPKTQFVDQIQSIPNNLEKYILKPLFSFAGQGVIIDIQAADFAAITDPENWILQEKVSLLQGENIKYLNISSLTTGVYFIRVFGWSKKIVVD
jgi:glutathionylspermidine synthase